jgi:hypothetical protein
MDLYPKRNLKRRAAIYAFLALMAYSVLSWSCHCADTSRGVPAGDLAALEARLRASVTHLAGAIGERNIYRPRRLDEAAAWIASRWKEMGLAVQEYTYPCDGVTSRNLETDVAGPAGAPIVLVGAHYDSVAGSPGADDNATGVAALLEVSRALARAQLPVRVRCVAFTNEEPPHFGHDEQGSRVYARLARQRGDPIREMLSLEALGFYTDRPGSQAYPPLLGHFYPDVGDFVGVVSCWSNRRYVLRTVAALRRATDVPVECASLYGWLQGVWWSDHHSFWLVGYPGVMVTDTAPFRNPRYHTEQDTPDTLDYPRLARVTAGIIGAVRTLARAVASE